MAGMTAKQVQDKGAGGMRRPGRGIVRSGLLSGICLAAMVLPGPALAWVENLGFISDLIHPDVSNGVGIGLFLGMVGYGVAATILRIRERETSQARIGGLLREIERLRSDADRAQLLQSADRQILVCWPPGGEARIEGDIVDIAGAAAARRVLAFGTWLHAKDAQALETAVSALKGKGEALRMIVRSKDELYLEAQGRIVAGQALLRIRHVDEERRERLRLADQLQGLRVEFDRLTGALDRIPQPVWMRDANHKLTWVNPAYAIAVEAASPQDAVARGLELLDTRERQTLETGLREACAFSSRLPAVVAGRRAVLDVHAFQGEGGGGGIATDVTELNKAEQAVRHEIEAHERTLDQLPTAVAIFDQGQRLVFCNRAYRDLWGLSEAFIETKPKDGEILDQLRVKRRIQEPADFQKWKSELFGAYTALSAREDLWHLPDNRSLRVVINPNPQGGITYLFNDVTDKIALQSSLEALNHVQRETLNTLREGVAVFATDGRLKLSNTAFAELWKLPPELLRLAGHMPQGPHVDEVVRLARIMAPEDPFWDSVIGAVTGLNDRRMAVSGRMARSDGSIVDCEVAPLPDGATLVTFTDMTASVNVERVLKERNEALEKSDRIRSDFVHIVSYELRSPLTTIIGFTQLLGDGIAGTLNAKQQEYAGHIMRSSRALMALIDDILDLASIDTASLELELGYVDLRDIVAAVMEGVQQRVDDAKLTVSVRIAENLGLFAADARRVRQIVFNLVSNAIGFSQQGQVIQILGDVQGSGTNRMIVIKVVDQGCGIPPELQERVFERFESHSLGSRHRGVGLGLSIVRDFVELHGGRVTLDSEPGRGTAITCLLPDRELPTDSAAPAQQAS